MQVFLCWSGPVSQAIAQALHTFLGDTIQAIKPFYSTEDIRKGLKWGPELSQKLYECNYGILCLTKDNLTSPWILFEAGALSKNINGHRVTALMAGIESTQVKSPLNQFQNTNCEKQDINKLIRELNELIDEADRLTAERLQRLFDRNWPDLETKINAALALPSMDSKAPAARQSEDMVSELLDLVRGMKRDADSERSAKRQSAAAFFSVDAVRDLLVKKDLEVLTTRRNHGIGGESSAGTSPIVVLNDKIAMKPKGTDSKE